MTDVRAWRVLRRLLPKWYRTRFSDELWDMHERRARGKRGFGFWLRLTFDVVLTSVQSRFDRPVLPANDTTGGATTMDSILQDIRYAFRTLRHRKRMTVLALLTFGIGIGSSTAMSSVLNAVLLRPLPFAEPERIVSIYARNPALQGHATMGEFAERGWFSTPEFRALRDRSAGILDGMALLSEGNGMINEGTEPERVQIGVTTVDLFSRVLRVQPLAGRTFQEEDVTNRAPVLVLTEGFWARRFAGDPTIVGRTIRFGETPYTVLGIVPREATLPGYDVDAWFLSQQDSAWGNHWLLAIGRLAPGVSIEQAQSRLQPVLPEVVPTGHDRHGINVFPRHADETRTVRGPLWLLGFAALLLLLVACGNVAALLIGSAIDREQELAVRNALGAARPRLVRQLLAESVLLGIGASLLGIAFARLATRALILIAPPEVPRIADAAVDATALGFAIAAAVVCSILFGLIPALSFSRTDLRTAMSAATRTTTNSRGRIQAAVVVGEVALATVVLIGAGLLARTLLALNSVDPGFAAQQSIAVRSFPPPQLLKGIRGEEARFQTADAYFERVQHRLRAIPGVRAVALTSVLPLSEDRNNNDVLVEGRTDSFVAERRFTTPNYFQTLGIRIVEGRAYTEDEDRPDGPGVTVISEGLARAAFPGQSAIGKRLTYWGDRDTRIVGVAADVRDESIQEGTALAFYVPRRQARQLYGTFVLTTSGDPSALIPGIRSAIREIDASIPIIAIQPMTELLREQTASQRYRARLIAVFAVLCGLLSLLGLYGITARNVAARTREMGLRLALGARPEGVTAMVLGQALRLCAIGVVLGTGLSVLAVRAISAYLYEVKPLDPLTFLLIPLVLASGSVLAALAPSRRAARVQPMEALRSE